MTILKLTILAEDILNSEYINGQDCAITRALARAGRPDLMDDANQIIVKVDLHQPFVQRDVVVPPSNEQYQLMQDAVFGMYRNKDGSDYEEEIIYPVQDMEFTIEF